MILLLDNYDSFTYNLFQQISELGADVKIVRNDAITIEEIRQLAPSAIVLSPGPGTPDDAGICLQVVQQLGNAFPILGICLGHQTIAQAFGGEIVRAQQIMHGRTSQLIHQKEGLLNNINTLATVMRYHSLVINKDTFPHKTLKINAVSEDGEIMAIQHRHLPIYGLQFHPESFGTVEGEHMISSFLQLLHGNE